jgi:L-threonylcarbamoyladenylate synthase
VTETKYVTVSAENPDAEVISEAARILDRGGLVAFPTETVYGLAADAFNDSAIRKVFEAKGRPSDNPLIVHIAETTALTSISASFPEIGLTLARTFWPGPLTLVVQRTDHVSDLVTAGLDTVAVRMPNHPVALSLIRKLDRGIVAPSANISGRPSPTTAQHVYDDLNGRIDFILDAGATRIGVESTVLDITQTPPVILRKGGLSREAIEAVVGQIGSDANGEVLKRSPGNRYKHYSPRATVRLVKEGDGDGLSRILLDAENIPKKVGCILHSISGRPYGTNVVVRTVAPDVEQISHMLFDLLRELDKSGVDVIIVEEVQEKGLGTAVMDRLRRASTSSPGY